MTQTEFALWVVLGVSVIALVVMQVRAMLAAAQLGGGSARGVIVLRSLIVVALLGLVGYVAWTQVSR